MQRYILDNNKNTNVDDFQVRDGLIQKIKSRFHTYGYKQVRTSTFESYDMYSDVAGTVNREEMIKVIDSSGHVLVLRPDVTIPLTRTTALNLSVPNSYQRLFYVLDVFRQSEEQVNQKESTQAGVECFGENSPEVDAELIMLSIHTLKDLGFNNFKIEIGHAGFFKELIKQTKLSHQELDVLLSYVQSKNIAEMTPYLQKLSIDEKVQSAIVSIPLLYGKPDEVIKQAKSIILNKKMEEILQNLTDVFSILQDFGVEDAVNFNFGLINNMDYYSGVIFQGFVDSIGKPVLMGGRYDHLSEQFGHSLPAIGFAFEVDLLIHALIQQGLTTNQSKPIDFTIQYTKQKQKEALHLAYQLRDKGYTVLIDTKAAALNNSGASCVIRYEETQNTVKIDNKEQVFSNSIELLSLIEKGDT
ncbi:ATP phosphoribosyltransferase regulatory subunit [Oceanobacillus piezotolerans]|uniref:ATP phosphoribosyltransferase regulatory subunit n=1 Tax=Oceanobacillus piezotolerans TaxID=2448030 RepID=A0A498D7Q8_9BACI|nr:ATP phosphoribosyltransferase regulatory subunit [Oceanobacillus piezotolerans]RLL42084.1 ATP phosphoribosyltransferase regulatory subunit [Oceanobacillus piezotolerans]